MKIDFINLIALTALATNISGTYTISNDHQKINKLQQYLRIKTVHPSPDYTASTNFLMRYGMELKLDRKVYYECGRSNPFVIFTIKGTSNLPSILLNSHTDVVPVAAEKWDHDPFEAKKVKDKNNKDIIVARGAQDTKALGIGYMEAIRTLLDKKIKLKRTVHIMFSPNEEIFGKDGMECFVETDAFKKLNVGFAWDEGIVSPISTIPAVVTEKFPWQFEAIADGDTGHASIFIQNLATSKLHDFHTKVMAYRKEQEKQVLSGQKWDGQVTSINLTILKGGNALNVVPDKVVYSYDCRVTPLSNLTKFDEDLNIWAKESGVTLKFLNKGKPAVTKFDKDVCPGMSVIPFITPATTDARWIRPKGIPVIGFSPFRNITLKAHGHNEYILVDSFLEGIKVITELITKLGNAN